MSLLLSFSLGVAKLISPWPLTYQHDPRLLWTRSSLKTTGKGRNQTTLPAAPVQTTRLVPTATPTSAPLCPPGEKELKIPHFTFLYPDRSTCCTDAKTHIQEFCTLLVRRQLLLQLTNVFMYWWPDWSWIFSADSRFMTHCATKCRTFLYCGLCNRNPIKF